LLAARARKTANKDPSKRQKYVLKKQNIRMIDIAIPKGSLQNQTLQLFEQAGSTTPAYKILASAR
jgi:hypothetical protein